MMRADAGIARLSEFVGLAADLKDRSGNPFEAADLMPWTDKADPDRIATEDDMKRMFGINR